MTRTTHREDDAVAERGVCGHLGDIYDPGTEAVLTMPCNYCGASASSPCSAVYPLDKAPSHVPHATRFIAHHDANCHESSGGRGGRGLGGAA